MVRGKRHAHLPIIIGCFFASVVIGITGLIPSLASADNGDELTEIRAELEILQQDQETVHEELREIKALLNTLKKVDAAKQQAPQQTQKPPAVPPLPMAMKVKGSPVLGQEDAPVVLIEFTDYHCPFCRRHFEQVHHRLIKEFVDTGKLKIVLKEFPLQKLHPLAPRAAMAAQCAGDQQQYWPMHDLLFSDQSRREMGDMKAHAMSLKLDEERFQECMEKSDYADRIMADFNLGVSAGVRGTPFFYLGVRNERAPELVIAEKYLYGAHPFEKFKQLIEVFLAEDLATK